MYGYNGYMNAPALQTPQNSPYAQMGYMQQAAQSQMQQSVQMQQPGTIHARCVTGCEESVVAHMLPNGRIYTMQVNPQTNSAEFVTYVRETPMRQEVPQCPTMEMFVELQQRVEQLAQTGTRRKAADAE